MKKLITILFVFAMVLVFSIQSHADWSTLTTGNDSSIGWIESHVEIFAIPNQSGPLYDISNVSIDTSSPFDPLSSQTLDAGNPWDLSPDEQSLDFNFSDDTLASGDSGWWKVHFSNPDRALFGVSYFPLGGWSTLTIGNSSNIDWTDFHVEIYAIPGQSGALYDISNVSIDTSSPFDPFSSQTLDAGNPWDLSPDEQSLDFNFSGDPYASGEVGGSWTVHFSNPDGALFGVSYYPSVVVPEPISSTLFIVGGATLGFRRLRKKIKK